MTDKDNVVKRWLAAASVVERKALAEQAGTTLSVLQQIAGAYRSKGELRITSDFARRLELASKNIRRDGLPELHREELSPACKQCEFAKRCR